jgi:predicted ATPase
LVDDTISQVEENGDFFFMPEALRVRGCALLLLPKARVDDAQTWFMRSLELGRRQGAQAWELRAAIDMAALLAGQGQADDACTLLQPIFELFVEGLETADLKAARRLLTDLRG